MFVSTQRGTILEINIENKEIISKWNSNENRNILGIKRLGKILYICTQSNIYKLLLPDYKILKKKFVGNKEFHHFLIKDKHMFLTATATNQIIKIDMDFNVIKEIKIQPPKKWKKVKKKTNYNHINNICYYRGKYYVNLNWLTTTQYSLSGIAVLNKKFKEINRFEYGWESHAFNWIEDKMYCLCGTSKVESALHPLISGLMMDGKIVYSHDINYFCKYFLKNDLNFYLFGGQIGERSERASHNGIIFILNKSYNLIKQSEYLNTGGFSGATF